VLVTFHLEDHAAELDRLNREELDAARRAGFRQAAPLSKDAPVRAQALVLALQSLPFSFEPYALRLATRQFLSKLVDNLFGLARLPIALVAVMPRSCALGTRGESSAWPGNQLPVPKHHGNVREAAVRDW